MRPFTPLVFGCIVLLLSLGAAPIQGTPDEIHVTVHIDASGGLTMDDAGGLATLHEEEPHERYSWWLELPATTYIEMRYAPGAFDVKRISQVVPLINDSANGFPHFAPFPRPEVWETDGPARVYHYSTDDQSTVLRLQIPGPKDTELRLERDVEPPTYVIGNVTDITRNGFLIETQTTEFAYGDMQRRVAGSDDAWVRLPTVTLDLTQRFPVQGLTAGTTYEVQPIFTDWAGNEAYAPRFNVTTLPPPAGPGPSFEVISPTPDAQLESGSRPDIQVRIQGDDQGLDEDSVRLFIDLQEVGEGWTFNNGVLHYPAPSPYDDGPHVVSVEATDLDGARGYVRWEFQVGEEESSAPGVHALFMVGIVVMLARLAGRRLHPAEASR